MRYLPIQICIADTEPRPATSQSESPAPTSHVVRHSSQLRADPQPELSLGPDDSVPLIDRRLATSGSWRWHAGTKVPGEFPVESPVSDSQAERRSESRMCLPHSRRRDSSPASVQITALRSKFAFAVTPAGQRIAADLEVTRLRSRLADVQIDDVRDCAPVSLL